MFIYKETRPRRVSAKTAVSLSNETLPVTAGFPSPGSIRAGSPFPGHASLFIQILPGHPVQNQISDVTATASISTLASFGSAAAWKAARAGKGAWKNSA